MPTECSPSLAGVNAAIDEMFAPGASVAPRRCRKCGCTDEDCRGCIERTGEPCYWIAQDLCSACECPIGVCA